MVMGRDNERVAVDVMDMDGHAVHLLDHLAGDLAGESA
jgi:hypothetical protein